MRVKDLLIELDRLREDEMDTILELINQVPPGPRQAFYEAYPEAITLLH